MNKLKSTLSILTLAGLLAATACSDKEGNDQSGGEGTAKTVTLLNVSYDPTRELYKEVNAGFARKWEADTGHKIRFNMRDRKSVVEGTRVSLRVDIGGPRNIKKRK